MEVQGEPEASKLVPNADIYSTFLGKEWESLSIVEFIDFLRSSYGLGEGDRILDVGCGLGRLFDPLTKVGWRVTGAEPHKGYYQRAVETVQKLPQDQQERCKVQRVGFQDLNTLDGNYDIIVSVNMPLSYLLSPCEREAALLNCYNSLKPGGVLFLDGPNFMWILRNYMTPPEETHTFPLSEQMKSSNMLSNPTEEGVKVVRKGSHDFDFNDATVTHTDAFEVYEHNSDKCVETFQMQFTFAIILLPDLLAQLERVGFVDIRTYRSWKSREHERLDGPRMMISAQVPRN